MGTAMKALRQGVVKEMLIVLTSKFDTKARWARRHKRERETAQGVRQVLSIQDTDKLNHRLIGIQGCTS